MRENLLGYLLGALDGPEQTDLEQQIENDPQLREQMQSLDAHLAMLEPSRQQHQPPQGLAERVCQAIDSHCREEVPHEKRVSPASLERGVETGTTRWTMADLVVVAGIFLAVGFLFFPAIAASHRQAQLAGCQNNLQQIGFALQRFSENNNGYYPKINSLGYNLTAAGLYAPLLQDSGLINEANLTICPASPLPAGWKLPTVDQLKQADGTTLVSLKRHMGGSYAYPLGYMEGDTYRTPRSLGRPNFAILSDAPSSDSPGQQSTNHDSCGQNVLFDDLHVQYIVGCVLENCGDHFFTNRKGMIAAGLDADDSVLGSSDSTPFTSSK